jgi:hypothetical protein
MSQAHKSKESQESKKILKEFESLAANFFQLLTEISSDEEALAEKRRKAESMKKEHPWLANLYGECKKFAKRSIVPSEPQGLVEPPPPAGFQSGRVLRTRSKATKRSIALEQGLERTKSMKRQKRAEELSEPSTAHELSKE